MKLILIDIILASWLLIIVESLDYFPRQVNQREELPYQPFIPGFRGYSSKDRFYQAVRSYPENSEYPEHPKRPGYTGRPEYSEHSRKGPCSDVKRDVNEAVKFCSSVMKRLKELKELLMGCDKVETPGGTLCDYDHKCYVVSEYYDQTPDMMYAAYQKACPCPQKHFSPQGTLGATVAAGYLDCLGQLDTDGNNEIVVTVDPNSNTCSSFGYISDFGASYTSPHVCTPTMTKNFLFVCEVPCSS